MNKNAFIAITGIAGGIGVALSAYSLYQTKKMQREKDDLINQLMSKMDLSVEEIRNIGSIDISDKLIEQAVLRSSREIVKNYAENGARDIRKEVISDIHAEAWKAVEDLKEDIKPEVRKTLEAKANKVTIEDIRKEVVDQCTKDSTRYIRSEMDDITRQYKKQIDNLTQVYNNISTAIGKEGK